jgi:hypothetical protein
MAREERADGNLADPEKSRRANCGHEAGIRGRLSAVQLRLSAGTLAA